MYKNENKRTFRGYQTTTTRVEVMNRKRDGGMKRLKMEKKKGRRCSFLKSGQQESRLVKFFFLFCQHGWVQKNFLAGLTPKAVKIRRREKNSHTYLSKYLATQKRQVDNKQLKRLVPGLLGLLCLSRRGLCCNVNVTQTGPFKIG